MLFRSRLASWNRYHEAFAPLEEAGLLVRPTVPEGCTHNAHMYYVKLWDLAERTDFIAFLKERGIQSVFHYIPLHSAPAGLKFGRFEGEDEFTTAESERLARLPLYYGLTEADQAQVIAAVQEFFKAR